MDEARTTSYIDRNGEKKTGITYPAYNKNTDYSAMMQQAASAGDYEAAGYYEQQRRNKINGERMSYTPTSTYADYYGKVGQDRALELEQGYKSAAQKAAQNGYLNTAYNQIDTNYAAQQAQAQKNAAGVQEQLDRGFARVDDSYAAQQAQAQQNAAAVQRYLDEGFNRIDTSYAEQLAANDAAARAQTELQTAALERQREKAAAEYQKLNRQLYTDSMQTQRTLPEQLAAMGYTGGATESSMLRNRLAYEQALRSNEAERISGERDIDFQIQQAALQQEIARQQAAQQLAANRDNSYYSLLGQQISAADSQGRTALDLMTNRDSSFYNLLAQQIAQQNSEGQTELDLMANRDDNRLSYLAALQNQQNYENQQALAREQYANEYRQSLYSNLVSLISNTGYTPTEEELAAAGMSSAEAEAWRGYFANNSGGASGGGGSSGGSRGGGSRGGGSGGSSGAAGSSGNGGSQTTNDNQTAMVNGIRQMMINGASKDAVSAKISSAYESGIINTSAATALGVENRSRSYAGAARGEKAVK